VGRFFLTLAFLMLVLLLIDSAMNDPDVQPVVDRQFEHVHHRIEAISSWIHTTTLFPWNDDSVSANALTAAQFGPHDGHGWSWYWSTMLAMAVAALSLAKSVTNEISHAHAAVTIPLRVGVLPTGRRP
jgi:hypothetical protein